MSQQTHTQLTLIMRQGPQPNQAFPLDKDTLTLGRAADNDIVISEEEVSRHHARLTRQGDVWILEDLNSRNGTFVGGQRIAGPVVLTPDSRVSLGPNVLLEMGAGPVPPAPPQAHPPAQPVSPSSPTATTAVAAARGGGSTVWLVLGGIISVVVLAAIAAGLAYVVLKRPSPEPLAAGVTQTSEPGLATTPMAAPDEGALDQFASLTGPDIAFLEPGPGTELEVGESVLVFATARDPNEVTLVELYVDDYLVVQQGSPDEDGVTPLTLIHNLTAIAPGTHALTVRAYNSLGETGDSPVIYVRVFDSQTDTARYVVQPGESLALLAQNMGTTEEAIRQFNPGMGSSIEANQVITVPAPQQPYEPPQLSISAAPTAAAPPQGKPQPGFFGDEPPAKEPQSGSSGGIRSQDKPRPDSSGGAPLAAKPEAKNLNPPHPDLPTPPSPRMQGLLASVQMGEAPGMIPMGALQDPGGFRGPAIGAIADPVSGAQNPLAQDPQGGGMQGLNKVPPPPNKSLPEPKWVEAKADNCTVTLKWEEQKTTDATHYEIYRMAVPADPGFATGPIKTLDVGTDPEHVDPVPRAGIFRYEIKAVKKEKGKITAWTGSNFRQVFVPVTAACVTDPKYKRVYFAVWLLFAPDKHGNNPGTTGDSHVRISIGETEFVRVPPYPVIARFYDWPLDDGTISLPAPPSLYSGSGDPMLPYDVTISTQLRYGRWNDSSFHRISPLSALAKPDLKKEEQWTAVVKDADNNLLKIYYGLWVDDVMWTGQQSVERTANIKAPYDLRLVTKPTRALAWTWGGNDRDLSGYIVYRFYSCPRQDSRLAAPQVVSKEHKGLEIPARNEYPGCTVRYQVSAYGPEGESALSNPLDLPATRGTARLSVTFTDLEITNPRKGTVPVSFVLFANQYKLESPVEDIELEEGKNPLGKVLLSGKDNNNSLLVDLIEDEQLQVGIVLRGFPPHSISLKRPKDTTWAQFGSATHKVSFTHGDVKYQLRIMVDGKGPTPSGPSLRSADISVQAVDVCGENRSHICVQLKNNGPDPVTGSEVKLTWFWTTEMQKQRSESDELYWPGKTKPDLTFSWITIPVGETQWLRIIDAKDQVRPLPTLARYLHVSYTRLPDSGLQDPNPGNDSMRPVLVWDKWFAAL